MSLDSHLCSYARASLLFLSPQCPPWVLLFLCVSRRIHSIFVLRCFNDCCAMLLVYTAIYFMCKNRWTIGCVFVTLAISIKMNILLFMPAVGILLLQVSMRSESE
jgi:alpha-1,3-mannosyltransferase